MSTDGSGCVWMGAIVDMTLSVGRAIGPVHRDLTLVMAMQVCNGYGRWHIVTYSIDVYWHWNNIPHAWARQNATAHGT